jgi:hypothetical protein
MDLIHLDAVTFAVTSTTYEFALPEASSLVDGAGVDLLTNRIYWSNDATDKIQIYSIAADATYGTKITEVFWHGAACGNSGLAIGGDLLFEGSDGCSHIWVVDKNTYAPAFDFPTGDARDEDLTCDPITFAPKHVMWSKEAYYPMRAFAFEIPEGTCGFGGLGSGNPDPPVVSCAIAELSL